MKNTDDKPAESVDATNLVKAIKDMHKTYVFDYDPDKIKVMLEKFFTDFGCYVEDVQHDNQTRCFHVSLIIPPENKV